MSISAKVIADSVTYSTNAKYRLITMEIELHRYILPEFLTHRMFSRNFQSSRALPLAKQRTLVSNSPANPVYWGANRAGMVAGEELTGFRLYLAKLVWRFSLSSASLSHKLLEMFGVHKQVANRLIEPFMYTKGVVTASEKAYKAFFKLRCASDAQPEIRALAEAMRAAMESSQPKALSVGDWHLPYVDLDSFKGSLEDAKKVSVSCCAQVSYRSLDDSIEKALKIYGMLNLDENSKGNPHASPCEHQAVVLEGKTRVGCGNFGFPWFSFRNQLGV